MRRVPVTALRPGQKLARPVYGKNGEILLNRGVILTERYIKRLQELQITAVYISDALSAEVEIDDVISDQTRQEAIQKIKLLLNESVNNRSVVGRSLVGIEEIARTVSTIIDELLSQPNLMVNLIDIRLMDEYTFAHSVNVCVLALITGIALKYSRYELMLLGMGAILHDIGKMRIPQEILNKPGKLTEEEYAVVKEHTVIGYNILREKKVSQVSALVALQHHERYNGEGYPQGLTNEQIHDFAKIVSIVDVYDALTADRIYRKAFPPHEAYEMLAGSGNVIFDFKFLKAFLQHVSAFPLGSVVELTSGEIGVVVKTYPGYPLHPVVKVYFEENGRPVRCPYEVKLMEERTRVVRRVLSEEEIQSLGYIALMSSSGY